MYFLALLTSLLLAPKELNYTPAHLMVYVDKTVPETYYGPIEQAILYWNMEYMNTIFIFAGSSELRTQEQNSIVIKIPQKWTGQARELMVTTRYSKRGITFNHTVEINNNFNYFQSLYPVKGYFHLQSLLVHELGHCLGLEHTEKGIMKPMLNPGEIEMYNVKDPNLAQFTNQPKLEKINLQYLWFQE